MLYPIILQWQTFNVSIPTVHAWVVANAGANYSGPSADVALTLWFTDQPTQDQVSAIEAYWAGLSPSSPEATSYVSAASAQAANLASATAKLTALGLTSAEIAALVGN